MNSSLFTELTSTEQEALTGGAYYYFDKDKWDVYRYYDKDKGGYYYKVYEDGYDNKDSEDNTFIR